MKNTISKCFAIAMFTITILSMLSAIGTTQTQPIFAGVGALCVAIFGLTLVALWISCVAILIAAVKETVRTGEGLSKLFQIFIGKVAKKVDNTAQV